MQAMVGMPRTSHYKLDCHVGEDDDDGDEDDAEVEVDVDDEDDEAMW